MRIVVLLAMCLLLVSAVPGTSLAQEPYQEWLEFFAGRWEVEERWRALPQGENGESVPWNEVETVTDWRPVPGMDVLTVVRPEPNAACSSLGWDPVKKCLVQTGYRFDGSSFRLVFDEIGEEVLKGKAKISFGNGETGTGVFVARREGPNKYTTEFEAVASDGMKLVGGGTFVRPTVDVSTFHKWADYFEGTWIVTSDDGATEEVNFSYLPGKYAMVGRRDDGQAAVQLVSWHPDRRIMVDTFYRADGGYSVVEYTDFGERSIKGVFTSFFGDGEDQSGAITVVEMVDENRARAQFMKGEELERTVTLRRKR